LSVTFLSYSLIFIKCNTGKFYQSCRHISVAVEIEQRQSRYVKAYMRVCIRSGWGIPRLSRLSLLHGESQVRRARAEGILRDDVTQQDTIPTQSYRTPDNSDHTGAILKGQRTNSGKRARILTPCVQFLTCCNIVKTIPSDIFYVLFTMGHSSCDL